MKTGDVEIEKLVMCFYFKSLLPTHQEVTEHSLLSALGTHCLSHRWGEALLRGVWQDTLPKSPPFSWQQLSTQGPDSLCGVQPSQSTMTDSIHWRTL